MSEEIFDICDPSDNVIRQASRAEAHAQNLLHRAVHIWIWRTDGRLLVHLRSTTKDQFPSHYTSSASGHVDAGEQYEAAAHRELKEELDLSGKLHFETKISASVETAYEHSVLYSLMTDETPRPDPGEIAEIEYFTTDELHDLLATRADQLTPPFRSLLKWWLEKGCID